MVCASSSMRPFHDDDLYTLYSIPIIYNDLAEQPQPYYYRFRRGNNPSTK